MIGTVSLCTQTITLIPSVSSGTEKVKSIPILKGIREIHNIKLILELIILEKPIHFHCKYIHAHKSLFQGRVFLIKLKYQKTFQLVLLTRVQFGRTTLSI